MKSKLFNNLGLKLLALIAAIAIWIVVVSINDPVADKTYRDVNVKILNEEVVTSAGKTYQIEGGTGSVSVTIRAQRSVLSRIRTEDIRVTADMKEMTLSRMIPIKVSVRGYEGRVQRVMTNPLNVQVNIEDIISNKFPVTVETIGELRDGYAMAGTEVRPQTVTFTGPKTVIRSIDQVAARISLTGISANTTINADLVLYDSDGETIDQRRLSNNIGDDGVTVEVEVYPTKPVPIVINDSQIRTSPGYYVTDVSYEPTSVEIAAPKDKLDGIENVVIPASAFDLRNMTGKTEMTLKIGNYLPDGAVLAGDGEARIVVTFSVARYGQRIFDVPKGSIAVDNLPEDLQMEYTDKSDLEITVQGPNSELEKLTLTDAVSIDLNNRTEPGTYRVPVKIKLPDNCNADPVKVRVRLKTKTN